MWLRLARLQVYFPAIAASKEVVEQMGLAVVGGREAVRELRLFEEVLVVQPYLNY